MLIIATATVAGAADENAGGRNVSRVEGKVGQAIHFDGADDHIVVEHSPKLKLTNGFTAAFWVKADGWSHQATMLMKARSFEITKRESPDGVYFWIYLGNHREPVNLVWAPDKFHLQTDRWHHLAVTYDARSTESRAYLDGVLQATEVLRKTHPQVGNYQPATTNAPLTMGLGRRPFHGALDSVFIYDRALSEQEIYSLMREQKVSGATAMWAFNEDDEALVRDTSGAGLDGRIDRGLSLENLPQLGRRVKAPILHHTPSLTIWQQQAMRKVMMQDIPEPVAEAVDKPMASLAANERESFQIVLRPSEGLSDVSIEVGELHNQDGSGVIAADRIDIARVKYVPVVKPSQTKVDGQGVDGEAGFMWNEQEDSSPGWYPDPLPREHTGLDLEADRNHPFWITVFAPQGTPPGIYEGALSVTAKGKQTVEVPVSIRVWDFELPQAFHTHNSAYFPKRHNSLESSQEVYQLFASHHFSMTPLLAEPIITFDGTDVKLDTEAFDREAQIALDEYGMNVLYMPGWDLYRLPKAAAAVDTKWHGFTVSHREGELAEPFKQAFTNYLQAMTQHLKSKGWLEKTRITVVDEPSTTADFSLSQQFSELVRRASPGVQVMVTRWPRPELMGVPDIWSLGFFQLDQMRQARKRGEQLEWYPNWHPLIDRPLMNTRIVGWVMWKHNITGILIWRVNHGWGSDPEQVWRAPRYDYADGRTIWGNGLLLYPDDSFNPVNSIRWEILRDAIEDYEYLHLLRTLCQRAEAQGIMADGAISSSRALLNRAVKKMVPRYEAHPTQYRWLNAEWSSDEDALLTYRSQIATRIEQLQKVLKNVE